MKKPSINYFMIRVIAALLLGVTLILCPKNVIIYI
jgi:hypothetical protein